jgi:hypothetical protein
MVVSNDPTWHEFAVFVVPFNVVRPALPRADNAVGGVDDRRDLSLQISNPPFECSDGHSLKGV